MPFIETFTSFIYHHHTTHLHRQAAVASVYMTNTTPLPPFAQSVPPPPPLIVLLRNSDFILEPLPTLLAYGDLPLKHTTHFESNHARDEALSNMDNWSPQALSSATSSPRATPMDNTSPSRLYYAPPTPRTTQAPKPRPTTVRVSKISKPRPKGAGRYNLVDIVEVETGLLEKIKVFFVSVFETPGSANLHWHRMTFVN